MGTVPRVSPYQTPRRREPPLPPRWVTPPRTIERTPLAQFVILSMLLHGIFILIFGAPSGGSREGRAMWGSLQVVLLGPVREAAPPPPVERPVAAPAPKREPERRPRVNPAPITPLEPSVAREIERTAVPDVRREPLAFPPLLNRIVTPERKLEMAPPLQLPKPVEAPPAPPAPPPPEVAAPPMEVPAPPVEVAAPVPITPAVPPPVERAPLETPALPAVIPTPPVERPPVEVPALPVPRIESIAPPGIEAAPKPVEAAPAQEIPVSPKPGPVPAKAEPSPTQAEPALRPSPFRTPAPSTDSSTYDPTAPGIDLDAIRNRAGQIAREGSGRRGLLAFPMPPVPERKSKMEAAIENARKPDCRTAYQNLGLAAIVPLIANEFGEGNCRW